jgi:AraC family transcriptional regulator
MTGILGVCQGDFGRVTYLDITRPITTHAHPHVHMLFKISGADRSMQVEDQSIRLTRGNWVLVNPWQSHSDIPEPCQAPTQMLAFYIDRDWCGGRVVWPTFAGNERAMSRRIRLRVDMLARLLAEGAANCEEWIESMVCSILCVAAQLAPAQAPARAAMDFRIRRAIASLREQTRLGPDFRAVARSVGMSRSRFFELFRNSVGVAPNVYVQSLLIERAINLLGENRPIDDIAEALGFAAQSSFTRFFKRRVGFPPTTLRQAPRMTKQ